MRRASVLIPTHEHAATLPFAVASVQAQGIDDIEILIVGDGVSDDLRDVVRRLMTDDPRIQFFDCPKGPHLGEIHRDAVLRQAQGRIVCYQSDDDLWLPGHLLALEQALDDADFAGAMQVNVDPDDHVRAHYFDLERKEFVEPWLAWRPNDFGSWACNGFGLQSGAHRLDAYRRLPEGWATASPGLPADQTMWHKFAREPWCRMRFLRWPISLHFPAPDRRNWTPAQRADELARWSEIIAGPDGWARICRDILADLGDRLLFDSLRTIGKLQEQETTSAAISAELAKLRSELADERALHQETESALNYALQSAETEEASRAALLAELTKARAELQSERALREAGDAELRRARKPE